MYAGCTEGHGNCSEQQVAEWDEEVNQVYSPDGFPANMKRVLRKYDEFYSDVSKQSLWVCLSENLISKIIIMNINVFN